MLLHRMRIKNGRTVDSVTKDAIEDEIKELEKLREDAKKNGEGSKVDGYTIQINKLLSSGGLLANDSKPTKDYSYLKAQEEIAGINEQIAQLTLQAQQANAQGFMPVQYEESIKKLQDKKDKLEKTDFDFEEESSKKTKAKFGDKKTKDALAVGEVTLTMIKNSTFGCKNCLWYCCECANGSKFSPKLTADGQPTCSNYSYYDYKGQ